MRFSTRTRYGLRFLIRLAKQSGESLTQLKQVAREEHISPGYLEQIVKALRPMNLFRVSRGAGGGFALKKRPCEIPLEALVYYLEGSLKPVVCLEAKYHCERDAICTARLFWMDFERSVRSYLASKTLQSILDMEAHVLREECMWEYSQAVHDHFRHPHNAGALKDANAIGEVGSLACGDALRLYLKISDAGIIEKAGFETFGCASAIASSSVLTDMVIGMHVDQALKLTNKDIVAQLNGLPKEKMHCSVMGEEALEAAIRNWRGEPAVPHAQEIGKLVCKCFGVTDAQIIRTIRENGLTTVEEVTNYTKAGGGCGECLDEIAEILANELRLRGEGAAASIPAPAKSCCSRGGAASSQAAPQKPKLTNVQRMQKVMTVLATELNDQGAGNVAELVDVDGHTVTLKIQSSDPAFFEYCRDLLRQRVEDDLIVVEV